MGQQASDGRTPVQGGIYVQLEKTLFTAGEIISGIIHVNLAEQYQGHILQVSLQGYEETQYGKIRQLASKEKFPKKNHFRQGFNMFLNYSIPIYDFSLGQNQEGFMLSPGQWSIPFQMAIGQQLPSTFDFVGSNDYASVVYRINATIIPTDVSVYPVQGIQEIFIAQISRIESPPFSDSQKVRPKTCCCCSGSDELEIRVELNKSTYTPGDTALLLVSCDLSNYSDTVLSFQVQLAGVLHLSMGIQFGQKLVRTGEVKDFKIQGKNFQERVEIPIPIGSSLSCKGDIVSQHYTLYVKPIMDGCCINSVTSYLDYSYSFQLPILINLNSNSINTVEAPPLVVAPELQNWNPTLLEPIEFSTTQATMVQEQQAKFQEVDVNHFKKYLFYQKYLNV